MIEDVEGSVGAISTPIREANGVVDQRHLDGLLMEEYKANVSLWIHDDDLRQQRNDNFLTVTGILITGLGLFGGLTTSASALAGAAALISTLGIPIAYIWHRIQARNAAYVGFRRLQLISIERRLPGLTTFQRTYSALYDEEPFEVEGLKPFRISGAGRRSSTATEGLLSIIVLSFWSCLCVGSVCYLVISHLV